MPSNPDTVIRYLFYIAVLILLGSIAISANTTVELLILWTRYLLLTSA